MLSLKKANKKYIFCSKKKVIKVLSIYSVAASIIISEKMRCFKVFFFLLKDTSTSWNFFGVPT